MSAKISDVLGIHSKQFHHDPSRHTSSNVFDSKYGLPPKYPGFKRSSGKSKRVSFCDTDSTDSQASNDGGNTNSSWPCVQFCSEIQPPPKAITRESWDKNECSSSSGCSASGESDSQEDFCDPLNIPGVHHPKRPQKELVNDVKSALNALEIGTSPKKLDDVFKKEVLLFKEAPIHQSRYFKAINHADWDSDHYSQSSKCSEDSGSYSRRSCPSRDIHQTLDNDDVRKIASGILEELQPSRPERSTSCSSSCSSCCLSCYGSCSNLGTQTPRPSSPALDIPQTRQKPVVMARIHNPPKMDFPRACSCSQCSTFKSHAKQSVSSTQSCSNFGAQSPRPSTPAVDIPQTRQKPALISRIHNPPKTDFRGACSCCQCTTFRTQANQSVTSTGSWITSAFCPQCLPPFDKDSLNSKISLDSLNHPSIFSLDSLNSLDDPDSLEFSQTNISIDSLNSLDSCCNYDSLSDSKDSGFFSCSLPVVC